LGKVLCRLLKSEEIGKDIFEDCGCFFGSAPSLDKGFPEKQGLPCLEEVAIGLDGVFAVWLKTGNAQAGSLL
jgi:hypothetical protein